MKAVSDPTSSSYRHYVTTAQWEARFSPTQAEVGQATAWLRSQGFKVGAVSSDRMTVEASGTAAQVESAFVTSLATYKVAGHSIRYASRDLSVPSSVASAITGVLGVNQTVATPAAASQGAPAAASAAPATASPYPPAPSAFVRCQALRDVLRREDHDHDLRERVPRVRQHAA